MAKINNVESEERNPRITASKSLWDKFDEWVQRQGCQTLAEGIRSAMRIVTNFDGQSQENSQFNNPRQG